MNIQNEEKLTQEAQIRQRFYEICDHLQLSEGNRPCLKIMEVDSRKNWNVFGRYSRRTNILQLSSHLLTNDYLAVHELIHFVCAEELDYLGSHGVPFLALHDLVVGYYMDGETLGNGAIIDAQWSALAPGKTRETAKEETARIVKAAHFELSDEGYSRENPPPIPRLVKSVRESSASAFCCSWQNKKAWLYSFDIVWTQKHGIYPMLASLIAWGTLGSILACLAFAKLFSELKWKWLNFATYGFGALALALILLLPVYQLGVRILVGYDLRKPEDGS